MDTLTIKLEVEKPQMSYVNNIIKAYEGLAMITIIGGETGEIELQVPPSTKDDVLAILRDLATKIELEITYIEGELELDV
ncbi:MAG: DUF4911 domain-containing protein [Bacillota bacterium]